MFLNRGFWRQTRKLLTDTVNYGYLVHSCKTGNVNIRVSILVLGSTPLHTSSIASNRGLKKDMILNYLCSWSRVGRGCVEPPWASQNDFRSLLIRRMTSKPRKTILTNSLNIFCFYIHQKYFFPKNLNMTNLLCFVNWCAYSWICTWYTYKIILRELSLSHKLWFFDPFIVATKLNK